MTGPEIWLSVIAAVEFVCLLEMLRRERKQAQRHQREMAALSARNRAIIVDNAALRSRMDWLRENTGARTLTVRRVRDASEIAQGCRRSTYFIPIPKPKTKGGGQLALAGDFATEPARGNDFINRVREHVGAWRTACVPRC